MIDKELVKKIEQESGVKLIPASKDSINKLELFKLPEEILNFYSEYEPSETAEINFIRLHTINDLFDENTDYVPGVDISKKGYIVFASNSYGDAYCFNLNESFWKNEQIQIVLLPHDVRFEDMNEKDIFKYCTIVASSFYDFVLKFANKELIEDPNY
jgi:hypothetical protein